MTIKELANSLNADITHIYEVMKRKRLPFEMATLQTSRGIRKIKMIPPETEQYFRSRYAKPRHGHGGEIHGLSNPIVTQFIADLV